MARTDSFRDWGSAGNAVTADAAAATAAATGAAAAEPLESGVDGAAAWRGAGDGERLALIGASLAPSSWCGAIARWVHYSFFVRERRLALAEDLKISAPCSKMDQDTMQDTAVPGSRKKSARG